MTENKTFPNVTFLIALKTIDAAGMTARDVLLLYVIMAHPGIHGKGASEKLQVPTRSTIQNALDRLIRLGMIEDRRLEHNRVTPNILYATSKGIAFWNDLKPEKTGG